MVRLIKAFLIGIIGLFIMITLLSLLIPSRVKISRIVIINNVRANKIFAQIVDLKNWKNWHPVFRNDSAVMSLSEPSTGKNAYCDISYNNRSTHLSIISVDAASVKFLLQSKGENEIENEISIIQANTENEIHVEWRALTRLRWYPWEKFYGIFIDKMTGPGYENALNGLKNFLEKRH